MLAREGVGEVVAIDVDGEMLAQARVRLAGFGASGGFPRAIVRRRATEM